METRRKLSSVHEEEEYDDEDEEEEEEEEEELVFVTRQSNIYSMYQSRTEKEMRGICSGLLEFNGAVLNQSNMPCYESFISLSREAKNVDKEILDLKKNCSFHKTLIRDLSNGYFRQLDLWKEIETKEKNEIEISELDDILNMEHDNPRVIFLQNLDTLIIEHRIDEALSMLLSEQELDENYFPEIKKRKEIIINQLIAEAEKPCAKFSEIKKALEGLIKLGCKILAYKLLLKGFNYRLEENIDSFLPFCSFYPNTYTCTLSQLFFSTISEASNESVLLFGEDEGYGSNLAEWAESEIENFVRVVKENAPCCETLAALRSAAICVETSVTYCEKLDLEGLKLSHFLLFLLNPYVEEVINSNFKRAKLRVVNLVTNHYLSNDGAKKFMLLVRDILDQLTPMATVHFRPIIMRKTHQLFDKLIEELIKSFSSSNQFKSQTITEQVLLMNSIFEISGELLPMAISKILQNQSEKMSNSVSEHRNWRRHIQHSLDKIIDYFCWRFLLNFIYTRERKIKINVRMYLELEREYSLEVSEWTPSSPFRALFARLKQLESVVSDIVAGKENARKSILSRTIETVLMWLSSEKEFWDLIEDNSIEFHQNGLQQLILDMHFITEIANFGGYSSRNIHKLVSAIITRAIEAFSARGVHPESGFYEDEWFSHAARTAIQKLMLAIPISSNSFQFHDDDINMLLHDNVSDCGENTSTILSDEESVDCFASVNNSN